MNTHKHVSTNEHKCMYLILLVSTTSKEFNCVSDDTL